MKNRGKGDGKEDEVECRMPLEVITGDPWRNPTRKKKSLIIFFLLLKKPLL